MELGDIRVGMRVEVKRLGTTKGMLINTTNLNVRAIGVKGRILGPVPGHGGDVWWIAHDDENTGAYVYDEFEQPDAEDMITILKRIDRNTKPTPDEEPFERPALKEFASAMETYLRMNDESKGDSWKTCDIDFLRNKLNEEIAEWDESGHAHELCDIANVCMMLWNRTTKGNIE